MDLDAGYLNNSIQTANSAGLNKSLNKSLNKTNRSRVSRGSNCNSVSGPDLILRSAYSGPGGAQSGTGASSGVIDLDEYYGDPSSTSKQTSSKAES